MKIQLTYKGKSYQTDLSQPLDISIPLNPNSKGVNCFFAPAFRAVPHKAGDFTGSVEAGAPVNFFDIFINPHGNGTHTECMGHISDQGYTINRELPKFHFIAKLITVSVEDKDGEKIISKGDIRAQTKDELSEALIIRTLPNDDSKKHRNYSGSNPPYLKHETVAWLVEHSVKHLLIDLPSVDREEDGGALLAHKAFWQFPTERRLDCTITELIYVQNDIPDGLYLLNIQIAPFELDVSPSKPMIYPLVELNIEE